MQRSRPEIFPSFPKLPQELQISVWELAASQPQAYFATLTLGIASAPPTPPPGQRRRRRFPPFEIDLVRDAGPGASPMELPWPPLDALLRTTRASRAAGQKVLATSRSVSLRSPPKESSDQVPYTLLPFRPMTDLIILGSGWQGQLDMRGRVVPTRQVENIPQLRSVGVPFPTAPGGNAGTRLDADASRAFRFSVEGLLTVYWALRVLYVVVEPEQLRGCDVPWQDTDLNLELTHGPELLRGKKGSLAKFLAAYEKGPPPATFEYGAREYFEVSADRIAEFGGLADVVSLLETLRYHRELCTADAGDASDAGEMVTSVNEEPKTLYFRLLTWR
ncbi:hypothetical protein CSOJ01_10289 [Colletotrichum sojae]|uniref:2EXR domain-containing protein n=1 Tax=Colletotrichum sojae TaxID=2175907 RepID=A0A8H6MQC9_9PEZI|nr:hypothetical protein CSOJ01_10289 [Colletotrichum sojae]